MGEQHDPSQAPDYRACNGAVFVAAGRNLRHQPGADHARQEQQHGADLTGDCINA